MKESAQNFIKRKNKKFEEELREEKSVISMKDIGGRGMRNYKREDWTFLRQSNLPDDKVLILERLKKVRKSGVIKHKQSWKEGDAVYRIGYFIVGQVGRAKGKWWWGQSCPIILRRDLLRLIKKAKKEKTIK